MCIRDRPYTQDLDGLSGVVFELRVGSDPLACVGTVRQIVRQASPTVPISDVSTQSRVIDQTISQERTFAGLCSCFAVLALLIAGIGLYEMCIRDSYERSSIAGISPTPSRPISALFSVGCHNHEKI